MAKGSSLKRKEMIRNLGTSRKKNNGKSKNVENYFPFPLEFSKLCLAVEAKIVTDVNLMRFNVYQGKI